MAEAGQAEQAIAVAQAISEGIWSLLERAMASFAAAGLDALVRIVKR